MPGDQRGARSKQLDRSRADGRMMVQFGVPTHIRSDNGAEFTSKPISEWLQRIFTDNSAQPVLERH